ncbi:MAG: Fur family transcriptional regulator [Scrofimicrobium sp.]
MAQIQRMTKQRQAVLAALQGRNKFRSAQQVHLDLVSAGESVSLATVYRNLQILEESGQVDAVRGTDGEVLYRLCEDAGHHHHLVCTNCGHTEEVDLSAIEPLLSIVSEKKGFELTGHELELFGLCPKCK